MEIRVVFPEPLGPRIPKISSDLISRVMSLSTSVFFPKKLLYPLNMPMAFTEISDIVLSVVTAPSIFFFF